MESPLTDLITLTTCLEPRTYQAWSNFKMTFERRSMLQVRWSHLEDRCKEAISYQKRQKTQNLHLASPLRAKYLPKTFSIPTMGISKREFRTLLNTKRLTETLILVSRSRENISGGLWTLPLRSSENLRRNCLMEPLRPLIWKDLKEISRKPLSCRKLLKITKPCPTSTLAKAKI